METLWIIIVILIYLLTALGVYLKIRGDRKKVISGQEDNLTTALDELEKKQSYLKELLEISLSLVRPEDLEELDKMLSDIQANIEAMKGKATITQTEVDAIEIRLRELGELKRELDVSNMDAIREIEMLKSQERDLQTQNEILLENLVSADNQIDILFNMFPDNEEIKNTFTQTKNSIQEIQSKLGFYQNEIATINLEYVALKKAYDALDIEYAQLYEKRQQSKSKDSNVEE
jgi:chromosome segregation ATPase